ncbi:Bet1-like SNARE 1-1 [Rhynchospora pubera]|uniref:Bet1-like SNARE 1-1 n=1 Tax=Rhynchospora pubera TaxID=906938 RepID=A0AAV8ERK3_9POAL|nr:Bet1-like SNARE 1-1 [Rhynchospora pubera]
MLWALLLNQNRNRRARSGIASLQIFSLFSDFSHYNQRFLLSHFWLNIHIWKASQKQQFGKKDMNSRRSRAALFDGIEEGGVRAYSSSHEIDESSNDQAMEGLQDRVNFLKRLTGDIHEEVQNHNQMLNRMGNDMDSSRGILSGTVDRFKTVFETKSGRRMATLVASFLALFLLIYYMTR